MYSKPAIDRLPELRETAKKYNPQLLQIVGINSDFIRNNVEEELLKNFVTEMDLNWFHLAEGVKRELSKKYFVRTYPSIFLLNKEGIIIKTDRDFHKDNILKVLDEFLM